MAEMRSEAMSFGDGMGINGNEKKLDFSLVVGESGTDSLCVFGGLVHVAVDSVERF